jgi:hypothetical protein
MASSIGSSCVGATSLGVISSLTAQGAADAYLTLNPVLTFFYARYGRYTNFAMEPILQTFQTAVRFGADTQLTFNRNGDLIHWCYLVVALPGIRPCLVSPGICGIGTPQFPYCSPCDPCGDGPPPERRCPINPSEVDVVDDSAEEACADILGEEYVYWTNAVGFAMFQKVCLTIGSSLIDTQYSDWMYMWEELTGQPGKRLREMIGKRDSIAALIADSAEDRILYVPLFFWFTRAPGLALPSVSLQFHSIQLLAKLAPIEQLIIRSGPDVTAVKSNDCCAICNTDVGLLLDTTYIFLDIEERDRFATGSFEQLIRQVQNYLLCQKSCTIRAQLFFNHPVVFLVWALRRRCHEQCNQWFNYSGKYGKDPIKAVTLRLNNQPRFDVREARYFRLVQPYQHFTNIPECYIYTYSFAIYPEEFVQPSGSTNFSRIDNVELIVEVNEDIRNEDTTFIVFAHNHNVLRFREGLAGLAFSS